MKKLLAVICLLLAAMLFVSCDLSTPADNPPASAPPSGAAEPPDSAKVTPGITPEITPTPAPIVISTPEITETPSANEPREGYVLYEGIVEHIFFHTLIVYPEISFYGNNAKGDDDWMVTVPEFKAIIESIYNNGYMIVNMNDVWGKYTNDAGEPRMKRMPLYLPPGKKPIIISFDDFSYYYSYIGDGYPEKIILREDGKIWSYGHNPAGELVISRDTDAIPILDDFVELHPDFSLNGAKGMLCMTGYDGIFGYRTQVNSDGSTPNGEAARQAEIQRVLPIVEKLRETGWYFASHTWGHIGLERASDTLLKADTKRWMDQVGSLLGPTAILVYPHGSRPDNGKDVFVEKAGSQVKWLIEQGFNMFCAVGPDYFVKVRSDVPAVMCDRIDIDGIRLRGSPDKYMRFYDARLVWDPMRRVDNNNFKRSW